MDAQIKLSEVISALSYALDITEGQPEGHAIRSALIGMRLARELDLPEKQRSALFYGLLLKDLGCSSNAAKVCSLFTADDRSFKRGLKTIDWTRLTSSFAYAVRNIAPGAPLFKQLSQAVRVGLARQKTSKELFETRCERGADIARLLGFTDETARAVRTMDEHWDGHGYPDGLRRGEIPLLGRIICFAQTVEVYASSQGPRSAFDVAHERSGKWFDPELVKAFETVERDDQFWCDLGKDDLQDEIMRQEPESCVVIADDERLDRVAEGFARVIDAKSPWTFRHSEGVAEVAVGLAGTMGFSSEEVRRIRRAALLHDIGKLGISNLILDKPGRLTDEERAEMMRHPEFTHRILDRVSCFREFVEIASSHHERLDGKGYHRGLTGEQLCPSARILVVADVFDAITAERPYRGAQPAEKALSIMDGEKGTAFCPEVLEALVALVGGKGTESREATVSEVCQTA